MKHLQYGVRGLFLAALGFCICVYLLFEFTPLTRRGDFYYRTGIQLPRGAVFLSVEDTTHESYLGDGHNMVLALVGEATVRELAASVPPWTDEWTIADWKAEQLSWFREYVNPDTTGITGNRLLFDVRQSDGETRQEIVLLSIDDGKVCYCRVLQ